MSAYNDDDNHHHPPHPHDRAAGEEMYPQFSEMEPRLDMAQFPTSSSHIHPHPHPLFTRQENMNSNLNRSLDPQVLSSHHSVYHSPPSVSSIHGEIYPPSQESSHGWPLYDHPVSHSFTQHNPSFNSISYNSGGYPSPSPFPPTRLSPPSVHASFKGSNTIHNSINASSSALSHRPILAGSLDPTTGIFYRTPEHPRLRTAQACEKCRTRKAKCSGDHPSCKRCLTRGLVCEYAKEGRVRGPNKPKPGKNGASISTPKKHSVMASNTPAETSVISSHFHDAGRVASRPRTASAHSNSSGSSEHLPEQYFNSSEARHALVSSGIESNVSHIFSTDGMMSSGPAYRHMRRDSLSLSEHRSSRPHPPDLHLDTASNLFRLSAESMVQPTSTTRDVSSSMGGLLPSPFQRYLSQHNTDQAYQSPAREAPFAVETGGHVNNRHPEHHEFHGFEAEVNQAQVPEFQRSVYGHGQDNHRGSTNYANEENCHRHGHSLSLLSPIRTAAIHHSNSSDMLNMDVSQTGTNIGSPGDQFLYPSPETYVHPPHERFQQRSYERGGNSNQKEDETSILYTPRTLPEQIPTSSSCLGSLSSTGGVGGENTGRGDVNSSTSASSMLAGRVTCRADGMCIQQDFVCQDLFEGSNSRSNLNDGGSESRREGGVSNGSAFGVKEKMLSTK